MWWLFEAIIFLFLVGSGAYLVHVGVTWRDRQRTFPALLLPAVLAIGWVTVFWGSFVEPRRLVERTHVVRLSSAPTHSIKAAVISDFHLGRYKGESWAERIVQEVNALEPDIILIPGDFIFGDPSEIEESAPLEKLAAPFGVWAVTGNHDYHGDGVDQVIERLEGMGIRVLQDENERVEVAGVPLVLAGASDIWYGGKPSVALAGVEQEDLAILLAHNPDVIMDDGAAMADLIISAHTHAGQIRLPGIGPVPPLPSELGRAYDRWLFSSVAEGSAFAPASWTRWLFISPGVGETGPRARLFNPPEISILLIEA